jgi:hypothetical protein
VRNPHFYPVIGAYWVLLGVLDQSYEPDRKILNKTASLEKARSIKGRVKRKNISGDWKERCCSLRSPAHVMLRGSGEFALRRSILFS